MMVFSRLIETNASRTAVVDDVLIDRTREVFHHRGNGHGHNLSEPANRRLHHGGRKLFQDLHIFFSALPGGPAFEHLHQLLRTHPARYALAAGLITVEASGIECHV